MRRFLYPALLGLVGCALTQPQIDEIANTVSHAITTGAQIGATAVHTTTGIPDEAIVAIGGALALAASALIKAMWPKKTTPAPPAA